MNKFIFFLIVLTVLILIPGGFIFAGSCAGGAPPNADGTCPVSTTNTVSLPNPLPAGTDINTLIGQVINGVLGIVGSLALVMFIYGGLMWMLAAGSAERVKKGKDILIWAVIGLIVIFSAYALVKFLFTNVLVATPASTSQAQEYILS